MPPTYTFVCRTCDVELEVDHRTLGGERCPEAGCDGRLRRVFHVPGVRFKGEGFTLGSKGWG